MVRNGSLEPPRPMFLAQNAKAHVIKHGQCPTTAQFMASTKPGEAEVEAICRVGGPLWMVSIHSPSKSPSL